MSRALIVLMLAALAACSDATPAAPPRGPVARVASLSPAITDTLVELGLRERLVGRTPWCQGVSEVPALGSMTEVDLERLAAAKPELVLLQRTASGAPAGLLEAAATRGWRVEEIPCDSLADVRALQERVASATGVTTLPSSEAAWNEVLAPVGGVSTCAPAVLLLSAEPVMAIGHDAFLSQAWAAWGGTTAPTTQGYPQMSLEDLFALRPACVILVGVREPSDTLSTACAQRNIRFERVEDGRLLRPGPALRDGLRSWRASLMEKSP
jgi:iron complex transport system substrate-binding protein